MTAANPRHPACFEMFKRMSLENFGSVAIDELKQLWWENDEHHMRFAWFESSHSDLSIVSDQFYICVPGTEYLAAHPLRVPALSELIQNCLADGPVASEVVFEASDHPASSNDPFAKLSAELKHMILHMLDHLDVANLRFVSKSFRQMPQTYFRSLVLNEMPWLWWDIESLPPKKVNWYELWCRLSAADGGSQSDAVERNLFKSVEYRGYQKAFAALTQEEREQVKNSDDCDSEKVKFTREGGERIKEIIQKRPASGRLPKSTEIKGLRNRRRIYNDLLQFMRAIAVLQDQDKPGE